MLSVGTLYNQSVCCVITCFRYLPWHSVQLPFTTLICIVLCEEDCFGSPVPVNLAFSARSRSEDEEGLTSPTRVLSLSFISRLVPLETVVCAFFSILSYTVCGRRRSATHVVVSRQKLCFYGSRVIQVVFTIALLGHSSFVDIWSSTLRGT